MQLWGIGFRKARENVGITLKNIRKMIKSMTGYGRGEAVADQRKIIVEIRSLNSKQLDLSVKMPSRYRQSEYEIRNTVAKRMQRGKVDVFICYESSSAMSTMAINRELFGAYYEQLHRLATENKMEWGTPVDASALASILRLPDVVQNETEQTPEAELAALHNAVDAALNHIDTFRRQEGLILITDLSKRIDRIEALKNAVTPYEKARTETIKTRIREQIEALNIPVDQNRLEQEMIYYIEKLDITEEKVRLQNHCSYFREVAHSEEGAGRKLGFITQELGREINTMGSKSNDANMQKMVVEMKDELEKIKEQLLNIL